MAAQSLVQLRQQPFAFPANEIGVDLSSCLPQREHADAQGIQSISLARLSLLKGQQLADRVRVVDRHLQRKTEGQAALGVCDARKEFARAFEGLGHGILLNRLPLRSIRLTVSVSQKRTDRQRMDTKDEGSAVGRSLARCCDTQMGNVS